MPNLTSHSKVLSSSVSEQLMKFIVTSIVASVILTLLLNVLPMLFPNSAAKAKCKMEEHEDGHQPRVKVFFPWKAMIVVSIVLTMLVNLISYFSRQ